MEWLFDFVIGTIVEAALPKVTIGSTEKLIFNDKYLQLLQLKP